MAVMLQKLKKIQCPGEYHWCEIYKHLLFFLVLMISCQTPARKPAPSAMRAVDSTKPVDRRTSDSENEPAVILKTHLKDTAYVAGNFILFLRPDDARYDELEKISNGEVSEGDADFGVGIGRTEDSLKNNDRYKDIKMLVSTNRFIHIIDCKDGPLTIDRDLINCGFILSAKGKPVSIEYNNVHSSDYIGEIEEYFFSH
jgi:hypothetical protein